MREHPILFKSALVARILSGQKTQTRRTNGLDYFSQNDPDNWHARFWDGFAYFHYKNCPTEREVRCPYGKAGDRLWVRETWQHSNFPLGPYEPDCDVFYRADFLDDPLGPDLERSHDGIRRKWRSPLHMPRSACRLLLEVTRVRIERLRDCSEADASAEGLHAWRTTGADGYEDDGQSALELFSDLWDNINGAGSWTANPWVWAVEFRRIQP